MLYWFRTHAGRPAPGVPYAAGDGHFENNLHGQTVGEFLMGAGTSLWWREDTELRAQVRALISELAGIPAAGRLSAPRRPRNVQNEGIPELYTRAWLEFGLLDAGYAGEAEAFRLARGMGDHFNRSDVLPYVNVLNLRLSGRSRLHPPL